MEKRFPLGAGLRPPLLDFLLFSHLTIFNGGIENLPEKSESRKTRRLFFRFAELVQVLQATKPAFRAYSGFLTLHWMLKGDDGFGMQETYNRFQG